MNSFFKVPCNDSPRQDLSLRLKTSIFSSLPKFLPEGNELFSSKIMRLFVNVFVSVSLFYGYSR